MDKKNLILEGVSGVDFLDSEEIQLELKDFFFAVQDMMFLDTYEGVVGRILKAQLQLWKIKYSTVTLAYLITQIERCDKGCYLNVTALAGGSMDFWVVELDRLLALYAREHGCKYISVTGRRGWKKILGPLGWEEKYTTFIRELGD